MTETEYQEVAERLIRDTLPLGSREAWATITETVQRLDLWRYRQDIWRARKDRLASKC